MRKVIKITVIVVVFAVIGVVSYLLLSNGSGIAEGKYFIKNNSEFPNAYAIVSGKTIQFFNIDFNGMFREQQLSSILTAQEERGLLDTGYTKEELIELSDINHLVVDQPYDFSKLKPLKQGTNEYSYFFAVEGNYFGLWVNYNTWDKVMKIPERNEDGTDIIFER
ncbi:MAG: hypothetical protein IKP88_09255 [Lachnospiraceae bacterium]|nr:hypothetical protein [Lachnospiraceae bacterium]